MTWFPQLSFRNGEISPHLDGLSNPEVYETSCRKLEGAIVSSSGTVKKRQGTVFVGDTKFSTTDNSDTYVSLACKLIPFTHRSDIYVLVFEVLRESATGADFHVIRAIVNNTIQTSVNATLGLGAWKDMGSANLPFTVTGTPYTGNSERKNYFPPGSSGLGVATSNDYRTLFGLHNFTASQIPELEYFQYEDILTVMHPDNFPMQVYIEGTELATRPYECEGRSPRIDIRGERFSMQVTQETEGSNDNFVLETTEEWFDDEDIAAVYRIGHWNLHTRKEFTAGGEIQQDYGRNTSHGNGFFVRITSIESPKKAVCRRLSQVTEGSTPDIEIKTEDPLDWDGPWIRDDDLGTVTFSTGTPETTTTSTTAEYLSTDITFTSQGGLTDNQLVGCIACVEDEAGAAINHSEHFWALSSSGTTDGDNPSASDIKGFLINNNVTGTGADLVNRAIYRLRDKRGNLAPVLEIENSARTFVDSQPPAIVPGTKVYLYVGNVENSLMASYVPTDHETAWDTVTRGTVTDPTDTTQRIDVGGVIHVDGGSFAIQSRGENCFIAYCVKAPISTDISGHYSLGWSHGVGFPSAGATHQGRVILAGFKNAPAVVVGSEVEEPQRFAVTGLAAGGIHFVVNDLRASRVRFLKSTEDLVIGTDTGEFSVTGSPLSSLSVGVDRQSSYGSASIRPVMVGTFLFFVQKDKKTLRAMRYIDARQRYLSADISSDHIHFFKDATIEEMVVWESEQDPVVFLRLSDGKTLGIRVNEYTGFFGWSNAKLPTAASVCPSRNYAQAANGARTTGDDFYIAVDAGDFYQLHRYDSSVYLDESVTMASTTATTLTFPADSTTGRTRIEHLDGQTVSVILDGVYRGEFVVTAGTPSTVDITTLQLSSAPTTAIVGKKIEMKMEPRVPETGLSTRTASTLGRVKNYSSIVVNLNDSKGVRVSSYEADGSTFLTAPNSVAEHPTLQGWYEVPVTGLYGVQPLLEISSDRPYPVEVTGVTIDVSVEG